MKIFSFLCSKKLAASVLLLCFAWPAFAVDAVPADLTAGWDALKEEMLKKDVSYLASDDLQGRLSLTKGDELAIQWIADQFKAMGLKPAAGTSYLQSVPLLEYMPDKKKSYVRLTTKTQKKIWKKPDVMTEFRRNLDLEGEVVFAGYGITAPDLNYDDYKNVDVRGKMVMVFEHEPQETNPASIFNGTANTRFAINRIKALNAQQHGAIAILIVPEPNRKHPSNQERYASIGGSAKRHKNPVPSNVLSKDELQIPIAILSDAAAKAIAGPTLSLKDLQTAIDKDLTSHSQPIPDAKVSLHDVNKYSREAVSYNVAGILEGSDPVLNKETIIVSAHHDHDGSNGKKIWHGADDNASGTAGVVAGAKTMTVNAEAQQGLKPKRSILFVVFTAEERGLLGAYYMSAHPLRPLASTRAMINFDMIGRNEAQTPQTKGLIAMPADTSNRLNLIGSHYSPDYQQTVVNANQHVGLVLDNRFDEENALNVFFRSDQFPFVLKNIPSFWWFTGFHPDYHHITDTADRINYTKMQKILRLAYLSAYAFANNNDVPKFIEHPGLSK